MRVNTRIAIIALLTVCASAQTPPATDPDSKLTPLQQREKQIRTFDPLDKSSPLLDEQEKSSDDSKDKNTVRSSGRTTAPLPGSVAASGRGEPTNPRSRGPQVVSPDDDSPVQEYTGPAVLSRSYTIARPMTPEQVKWSPRLGFTSSYDVVLGGDAPAGEQPFNSGFGYSVNWGITGRHFWKHDQVGLDYSGSQSRIGGYSTGSGTNHNLNADYQHQFSRRLSINIVSSGSILSQTYGLQDPGFGPGTSIANVNIAASPTIQVLDTGTRQLQNQVSLTFRKSNRLSFSAGGGVFFVQRTGGLYGSTGYQSQADVNYRMTRKTTVGVYYSYTNYIFSQRVSLSNQHTVGGIYSYALGRSTQLRLRAGVTRIETEGFQAVAIDPAIAAILGQQTTIVDAYHRNLTSDVSAQLARDFRHGRTASLSYVRGVSPGNGLLLTSVQEAIGASFAMTVFRRYGVGFAANRSSLSSVGQNLASQGQNFRNYDSQVYGVSVNRPVSHHLNADFRIDYRTFNIVGSALAQKEMRISSGISWGPGENWLRSW